MRVVEPAAARASLARRSQSRRTRSVEPLLAHADDALAGVHVAVAQDEVAMGVVLILALVVEGGEPGGPPAGQLLGEAADQLDAPLGIELAGQGEHDLVDDAGVLAVGLLLAVHPSAGAPDLTRAGHGHVLAHDLGAGALAGDVLHVGAGGAGAVGGASDGGVVEREHPGRSPAPIPASRGASRTPSRRASHEPPEDTSFAHMGLAAPNPCFRTAARRHERRGARSAEAPRAAVPAADPRGGSQPPGGRLDPLPPRSWGAVERGSRGRQLGRQPVRLLRGRPPFAPFARDAAVLVGEVARPAVRAHSLAIQSRVPNTPATRAGT